jgi:hypothetical protein
MKSTTIFLTLTCLLNAPSFATWGYPEEYRVALYDAAYKLCRPVDSDVAKRGMQSIKEQITLEKPDKLRAIRKSELYKSTYAESITSFSSVINTQDSKENKTLACKAIMRVDGFSL